MFDSPLFEMPDFFFVLFPKLFFFKCYYFPQICQNVNLWHCWQGELVHECVRACERARVRLTIIFHCFPRTDVSLKMKVQTNEQTNEQTNKQMNERTNKRTNKQKHKLTNKLMNKPTNEEAVRVKVRVSQLFVISIILLENYNHQTFFFC